MATIYVSQSETNGYAIGNDANTRAQAASKSTPKLTITSALSASVAGDIIVVNDGTYQSATAHTITKAIDIISENNTLPIVQLTSAGIRALIANPSTLSVELVGVTVDANSLASYGLDIQAGLSSTIADGCKFLGSTLFSLFEAACADTIIKNCDFDGSAGAALSCYVGAGLCQIRNNTMNFPGAPFRDPCITVTDSKGGGFAEIFGNVIDLSTSSASVGIGNTDFNADIICNTINCRGTGFSAPISIKNSANIIGRVNIVSNILDSFGNAGYGVQVGDDAYPATPNMIANVVVCGNIVTRANHGLLLGAITGAIARFNEFSLSAYGVVDKNTIGSVLEFNTVINSTTDGGAILSRGSTDSAYKNNLIFNDADHVHPGLYIASSEIPRVTTGAALKCNIVYSEVDIIFVSSSAGSEAIFENNFYFSEAGGGSWKYNGVTYNSIEEWNALSNVTNDRYLDPKFIDVKNGDMRLRYDSPLVALELADVGCYPADYTE